MGEFPMSRKSRKIGTPAQGKATLFAALSTRRRKVLILPSLLAEEAAREHLLDEGRIERAYRIIAKWADLGQSGDLEQKETSLDAEFIHDIFVEALGYPTSTEQPGAHLLERNYTVPNCGTADAAIGEFGTGRPPIAVIELKAFGTDLDRDRFNGRTAVQQCWDYLNALPDCPWGIVSNFQVFRLYHRARTPSAYEEFDLVELRDQPRARFRQFYCLFESGGLLRSVLGRVPRAARLLEQTETRQEQVGDRLYEYYSTQRLALIQELQAQFGKSRADAIRIAQKLLDRIIFVAFCEDRGLLPGKVIERTYREIAPFTKVTNPRWRNFLELFRAVDEGHGTLKLDRGFDGGLFRRDPDVDDLQLPDRWATFFNQVGNYDFRDEVNVDVLGHLFEKSVTELERLKGPGFFQAGPAGEMPAVTMPKSPQRKRFGIFYTSSDLTGLIVHKAVGDLVRHRLADLARQHGIDPDGPDGDRPSEAHARYWREGVELLRGVKICDPACGSGAFLIQAYDVLENEYHAIVDQLVLHDGPKAEQLLEDIPNLILRENLYGADLSAEAVEITQLALWLRSARPDRTLADLSDNIICGNSLVSDPTVHPQAFVWEVRFPAVFERANRGFDCVIGNPPWERIKLQEREFFALSAPHIAGAVSAADRRRLIGRLEQENPDLHRHYQDAAQTAAKTLQHVRDCGRFPLSGKGDVNTYTLFAELARSLVTADGRVGLLVPSGIATDNSTRQFFGQLVESDSLIALYDFENKKPYFPDVHRSFKFSMLVFHAHGTVASTSDFFFFAHDVGDLDDKARHIELSARDIALVNPNTRTCPIFRTRRDAELTRTIYRRVPVLWDRTRKQGGNPWGVRFLRMFDQTNDAELFRPADALVKEGFKLEGNVWRKRKRTFLPLYEAKMVQAYDHRAASVVIDPSNWVRQGQTEPTSLADHQNPEFVTQPRWWVDAGEVLRTVPEPVQPAYLCYKDVTSPTNERTMIAAFVPLAGVVNSAPLIIIDPEWSPRRTCCLLANLNSFALDFVARQKVGGVHLNFFIVEQLPLFSPDAYDVKCPWKPNESLERWISARVLKLTCTSEDMVPLAKAAGLDPPVHKWRQSERLDLLAELDASFFILYGLNRNDIEYVLSTFPVTSRPAGPTLAQVTLGDHILAAFDRLAQRL